MIVARALLRPLRVLHDSARRVAEIDLPAEIARIHAADESDAVVSFTPVPVDTDEEIGRVARAVDDIHGQALRLAEQQRKLRLTVNDLFDALARRTKALLDRQLVLIGALEEHEQDPERLESLFQLDHLATRMRRNGDNLLVLAGTEGPPTRLVPMPIAEVVQASISEVEQYQRVRMEALPDIAIKGVASVDVVHLISELLDNALRASPPDHEVLFRCLPGPDGGVVLEIVDQGIGIGSTDLAQLNAQLSSRPEVSPETARRMGLFVVGRLAERHGITVRLQRSAAKLDAKPVPPPEEHREGARLRTAFDPFATGVTATVFIPVDLLAEPEEAREAAILDRLEAQWWG
jgi:signal transduction histidine kinase